MTHLGPRIVLHGSAVLRIPLAVAILVWCSFGQAHFLHSPAPELDPCGRACPLHLTSHSVDSDPDACGICQTASAHGFDFDLHVAVAVDDPGALAVALPTPLLAGRAILGPASPRGPPTA